jgi:phosphatidylinositol phospholipase C, gamma-1
MFDPYTSHSWEKAVSPVTVKIKIISARHLIKPGKGIASPYVHVEVSGVGSDTASNVRRTKIVPNNGFRPRWNEDIMLEISMPELACISFTVFDEDQFGDSNAIGQAVLPLGTPKEPLLRNGYRSVQLKNIYNFEDEISAMLIHVDMKYGATKHSIAMLKLGEQLRELQELRSDLIKEMKDEERFHPDGPEGAPLVPQKNPKLDKVNLEILAFEKKIMALG